MCLGYKIVKESPTFKTIDFKNKQNEKNKILY